MAATTDSARSNENTQVACAVMHNPFILRLFLFLSFHLSYFPLVLSGSDSSFLAPVLICVFFFLIFFLSLPPGLFFFFGISFQGEDCSRDHQSLTC